MQEKEGHLQALVSFMVVGITVVLILPVWWNTTKVYRASIPQREIFALSETQVKVPISVRILLQDDFDAARIISNFTIHIRRKMNSISSRFAGSIGYTFTVKSVMLFSKGQIDLDFGSISDFKFFENSLTRLKVKDVYQQPEEKESGNYLPLNIFIFHSQVPNGECFSTHGLKNHVLILANDREQESLIDCVKDSLLGLLPDFAKLTNKIPRNIMNQSNEALAWRAMQHSLGLQLAFVLVNPQPDKMIVRWNIKDDFDCIFQPFLTKISAFGPFHISSQVLYYTEFPRKPIKSSDGYYYRRENLPLLMNHLEAGIESFTSNTPILYFVAYVAPPDQVPLKIKVETGKYGTSFLSPKWGGVYFYNTEGSNRSHDQKLFTLDMRPALDTFIEQLKVLIGLNQQRGNVKRLSPQLFPLDTTLHMLEATAQNLVLAAETLNSLCRLLEDIHNIVISDDIRDLIQMSIQNSTLSMNLLSVGNLEEAYRASRQALSSAEWGFFDPSLLELLYFPDDQKYAIYVPFFLPVSVPVILSFFKSIRYIKNRGS